MNYEQFKNRNLGWDDGICMYHPDWDYAEKKMRENYEIYRKTQCEFYKNYKRTCMLPQVGDVVEFVNNNRFYKNATVENIDKYGLMCICEQSSTWTDGKYFSTSGGTWTHRHQSNFEFVGYTWRRFWTWGANGSGGNQGIYFDILVKRFRQRNMPTVTAEHEIRFCDPRYKDRGYKVVITYDWSYIFKEFKTIKEFKDWAAYVGLTYQKNDYGRYWTNQFLRRKYVTNPSKMPTDGKPIKMLSNGYLRDSVVCKDGNVITFYIPNY